ncbi:LD-carboxypeptidase [Comamonas serinivorans]|uniref:LD-carboxypeptidase n=1 Tax=Comamonas serinivorans TaxID=1082851 RepID=A0A1Y0EMN6_9BURK|nr:LD-carboxypeptidase [Comamonas serinivorans]ARU04847.1 LD-carboxypeptidase [Comamonas serinivorans]
MAHIYIYSPSGAVRDKAAFRRGIQRLKVLGHEVEVDPAALASVQRFAGDDAERVAAIARAAASGADVSLISRGGYGLTRILPDIDFAAVAQAAKAGMRWVGFSDFTALQLGALAKTGATTWSGPALIADIGAPDEPDDITLDCLDDVIHGHAEGTGWVMGKKQAEQLHQDLQRLGLRPEGGESVRVAEHATLWGGNLAVVAALLGTPYFPQVEGGVLYLEDVGEPVYRIERLLTQLQLAGVLTRQKAVVLGGFTEMATTAHDKGFSMKTVVARLAQQLPVPVIPALPFGHVPTKVCLPTGACVSLSVHGREVMMLWDDHDHDHDHDHHGH